MIIYLLEHARENGDCVDIKRIGLYLTKSECQSAISRAKKLNGFKDFPDGFSISPYEVGVDHWKQGFVSIPTDNNTD